MSEHKKFTCLECGRTYGYRRSLRKHVSKEHPGKISDIVPSIKVRGNGEYLCSVCGKRFTQERYLKFHERNDHSVERSCIKLNCPLCDISFPSKKRLYNHLEMVHNVSIESVETEFESFQDFCVWKQQTERNTLSRYVRQRGSRFLSDNVTRYSFVCHRSGQYLSQGKGIRHLKTQGTNKIGGICPSSIEVTVAQDGSCKVKYIVTHIGHENDVDHLNLTEAERNLLAVDIANGIPFDVILDKIRDSLSDSKLERIHLVTKKDLHNIRQCMNIRSDVTSHKDDGTSVDIQEDALHIYEEGGAVGEEESILAEPSKENIVPFDLNQQKEEMRQIFENLLDSISSLRQMEVLKRHLSSLKATLADVDSNSDSQQIGPCIAASWSEANMQPEIRLFSTRKKRKIVPHFQKPYTLEAQEINVSLLQDIPVQPVDVPSQLTMQCRPIVHNSGSVRPGGNNPRTPAPQQSTRVYNSGSVRPGGNNPRTPAPQHSTTVHSSGSVRPGLNNPRTPAPHHITPAM